MGSIITPDQAIIRLDSNVQIDVHDAHTGRFLFGDRTHNLVVTAGRNLIRDLLSGTSTDELTHFGVGTSSTAVAAGDTDLGAVIGSGRDTITQFVSAGGSLTVKYYLNSSTGNGSTLREAGIFNASAAGTMFARTVHSAIVKTSSVTVTYSWLISISAS